MKGQVLVKFLVECSIPSTLEDYSELKDGGRDHLSTIYIVGSSNDHGIRVGIILKSLDGYISKHSIKFGFRASNNVAECEAALAILDLAKTIKAKNILIKSNSQVIMGQSTGEFEAR